MIGIFLYLLCFASAPATNVYFLTQANDDVFYWASLGLYVWAASLSCLWGFTQLEWLRGCSLIILGTAACVMSYRWGQDSASDERSGLYLVYMMSVFVHLISLYVLPPMPNETPKVSRTSDTSTPVTKDNLKEPLVKKTVENI
jgi:hypothetical protein